MYVNVCRCRYICIYTHKHLHTPYTHTHMVRRLAFPGVPSPPPPQWYGLVRGGGGGGAGVCGEGWGPLELQLEKRPGVTDQASIVRKPYASHKSYNVAQ